MDTRYMDGSYLDATHGTWHLEDSPHKASLVLELLRSQKIEPRSVCEVGCGSGGVLATLRKGLPDEVSFTGYEISPQAHAMSLQFANERCRLVLGDAFADKEYFDVVLAMDVMEHVEDCFSFLRKVAAKGRYKIYHVPLDAYASTILRGYNNWDAVGHLHLFTIETALKTVASCDQTVIDWRLVGGQFHAAGFKRGVANLARRILSHISPVLTTRLIGSYSLLILAE